MAARAAAAPLEAPTHESRALQALTELVAEFDLGNLGENSVDTEAIALAREVLGKVNGAAAPIDLEPIALSDLPRIGAELRGGEFAGIARGEEGDHALILLPAKPAKALKWKAAMQWAEKLSASLPTRSESALLFANLRDRFGEGGWHWTCEQYAGDEGYAWYQTFDDGNQYDCRKFSELRARAVRRLPIR